jgi:hypothetical protein
MVKSLGPRVSRLAVAVLVASVEEVGGCTAEEVDDDDTEVAEEEEEDDATAATHGMTHGEGE